MEKDKRINSPHHK